MYKNIVGEFTNQSEMFKLFPKTKNYNLKDIFKDYWDSFISYAKDNDLSIRPVIIHEISRLLKCKTNQLGYSIFKCTSCDNEIIIHNTCKSRLVLLVVLNMLKIEQLLLWNIYSIVHTDISFLQFLRFFGQYSERIDLF